jgi:hypothetical protein
MVRQPLVAHVAADDWHGDGRCGSRRMFFAGRHDEQQHAVRHDRIPGIFRGFVHEPGDIVFHGRFIKARFAGSINDDRRGVF